MIFYQTDDPCFQAALYAQHARRALLGTKKYGTQRAIIEMIELKKLIGLLMIGCRTSILSRLPRGKRREPYSPVRAWTKPRTFAVASG